MQATTQPSTSSRVKIGNEFYQSGYGRGKRKAPVYLIDGYAYARCRYTWNVDFSQLTGDLEGYVRVNAIRSGSDIAFAQCNEIDFPHNAHQRFTPAEVTA